MTNTDTSPLSLHDALPICANTGDFNQTNNCPLSPSTLAVNGTCTLTVRSTARPAGARSAAVSVTDNAAGSPQTVSLSGTGTTSAVTLSPSSLAFGNQQVTTTSPAQNATLTNSSSAPLTISSISLTGANTGDFNQTNNCPLSPSTLAVNGTCTLTVTFTPTTTGARSASVSEIERASCRERAVSLVGAGTTSAVNVAPSSLAFGNQQVSTTSPAQNTTLTKTASALLICREFSLVRASSGDFNQTNNCPLSPSTLAVNGTCTLTVTFTPTTTGARSASVS